MDNDYVSVTEIAGGEVTREQAKNCITGTIRPVIIGREKMLQKLRAGQVQLDTE